MKTAELIEQHNKVLADMRSMVDAIESENRGFNPEERAKWDAMVDDSDSIKDRIEVNKKMEEEERDLEIIDEVTQGRFNTNEGSAQDNEAPNEERVFDKWVRQGFEGMTHEERSVMQNRAAKLPDEARALTVTTTAGGHTIPEGFRNVLEDALLRYGGMRQANTTVLSTDGGSNLPMPTANDTGNSGAILAINTQAASDTDPTFGQVVLGAYMYTSKIVLVPIQLLQDSGFDIGSWLGTKLGQRIGRATNAHFTTGTGTGQPRGVSIDSTLGKTGTTGQTTTVIYNDLVDLVHSVDPDYRMGAQWMFADSTLKAIRKLVDGNSLPLWQPGTVRGEPSQILGHDYVINQDVPAMGVSAQSIYFGDFSKYMIRDVTGAQLLRLGERYMDYLQVGFMAFSRHDGSLLDAGTNPIKHYANSAT